MSKPDWKDAPNWSGWPTRQARPFGSVVQSVAQPAPKRSRDRCGFDPRRSQSAYGRHCRGAPCHRRWRYRGRKFRDQEWKSIMENLSRTGVVILDSPKTGTVGRTKTRIVHACWMP